MLKSLVESDRASSGQACKRAIVCRLAFSLVCIACQAESAPDRLPGDWVELKGERVKLLFEAENKPCAGNVERLDALVAELEAELDTSAGEVIQYYYVRTRDEVEQHCDSEPSELKSAIGCASPEDSRVVSTGLAHTHELVHVLLNRDLTPNHNRFVSEGLAEYFGSELRPGRPLSAPLEQIFDSGLHQQDSHLVVGYLIDLYGLPSVLSFYRQLSQGSSFASFQGLLVESFGLSAKEIEAGLSEHVPLSYPFEVCAGFPDPTRIVSSEVLERAPRCEESLGDPSLPQSIEHVVLAEDVKALSFEGGGRVTSCSTAGTTTFSRDEPDGLIVLSNHTQGELRLASWGAPTRYRALDLPLRDDCMPFYSGPVHTLDDAQELLSFLTDEPTALPFKTRTPRTVEAPLNAVLELCTAECACSPVGGSLLAAQFELEPERLYFLRSGPGVLGAGTPGSEQVRLLVVD